MVVNFLFSQGTTGSASTQYFVAPYGCKLESVELVPADALAANDTNFITFKVIANDLSTEIVNQTTEATGGAAFAADTKQSLVIDDAIASELAEGELFKLTSTADGTLANAADYTVVLYFTAARSV